VFASVFCAKPRWNALHEINEILERKDINDKHKALIFGESAKRFYNLSCKILCCTEDASGGD
jgi:hypothetical protein